MASVPLQLCDRCTGIARYLQRDQAGRLSALRRTLAELTTQSRQAAVRARLRGRLKSIASISDKMGVTGRAVHQILDLIGIRAITENTSDCYRLARRVHRVLVPLGHAYDDYIAEPKPNGYQSIHTTVISAAGFPVEIQIRTESMDARCMALKHKESDVSGCSCATFRAARDVPEASGREKWIE